MKRLITIAGLLLCTAGLNAQPWLKNHTDGPLNLRAITEEYKKSPTALEADDDDDAVSDPTGKGQVREKKDYHFDRWEWYMRQHTDSLGNIVSPLKNYEEWTRYQRNHALAKGTGTSANWSFQGPSSSPGGYYGVGRIQAMAFHPTDSNTYWIGSGGGGAWVTTNNGVSWTCKTDNLPVLGVSDIVYNPLNPQVIYLCTGDRDAGDSYSIGVLKSTDGGQTWGQTGLAWTVTQTRYTNSLVINPNDTATLLLATSVGIYKTSNSGASWTLEKAGNFKQIMYRPADSMVAYAATTTQLFRTANAGTTWNITTLSITAATRVAFAVTPANPNLVKAVVANSAYGLEGIYSSVDTGKTFTKIYNDVNCTKNILANSPQLSTSSCGGQGWYDLAIAISPLDTGKILVGGVNTWYSTNGGYAWTLTNQWTFSAPGVKTVHADKHFLAFQPLRPSVVFEGSDGGVYRTANFTTSSLWTDLTNGLGITQFYRNAVSNNASFVLGGAQDNGSKRISFSGGSTEQTGGDGMNCEIDYSNPAIYYTAIQYGSISRTTNSGGNFSNISNNIPGQPQGDWTTPYVLSPSNPATIYAGYSLVYSSADMGSTWTAYSPSFGGANIQRLALSKLDPLSMYVVVNNNIKMTHDNGATWDYIQVPYSGTISDIIVSPKHDQHIWITFSGYNATKVAEYDTLNGWTAHSNGLPNVPANCIVIDTANGTKYIGTDVAVFRLNDTTDAWEPFNTGLPAAEVRDLGINYTTDEIWAATFGRGMWKSAKFDPPVVTPNGISMIPLAQNVISVSPNPSGDGRFNIATDNAALKGRNATVQFTDMAGRSAWHGDASFDAGGNAGVNAGSLANGTYILQVTGGSGLVARTKVVVSR